MKLFENIKDFFFAAEDDDVDFADAPVRNDPRAERAAAAIEHEEAVAAAEGGNAGGNADNGAGQGNGGGQNNAGPYADGGSGSMGGPGYGYTGVRGGLFTGLNDRFDRLNAYIKQYDDLLCRLVLENGAVTKITVCTGDNM